MLWLLFGSQRCRLLIVLPLSRPTAATRSRKTSNFELVLKPAVRRFGDAKGELLDHSEIVRNCEMETRPFTVNS
jgi:hypothetical protein